MDKSNALKAVSKTDDELRVANHIVLFGGADLAGEYFTDKTKLESSYTKSGRLHVDFEHGTDVDDFGLDEDEILGYVDWKTVQVTDRGVLVERVLNRRNQYVQMIEELIEAELIGNSSEAIKRGVNITEAGEITNWPLKRDTLTVWPFEPRMLSENAFATMKALSVKSPVFKSLLDAAEAEAVASPEQAGDENQTFESTENGDEENIIMEPNEIKAAMAEVLGEFGETIAAQTDEKIQAAALEAEAKAKALQAKADAKPDVVAGFGVEVIEDEADKSIRHNPLKAGEFFQSVKLAAIEPHAIDQRLLAHQADAHKALKQLGLNEAIPSDGGFLVTSDIAPSLHQNVWNTGELLSMLNPVDVSGNGLTIRAIDESSRATGSRMGGVQGYWLSEGLDKTSSKPKFRNIELKLKKAAALVYATDELLEDAMALGSWINNNVPSELTFMAEDGVINGDGVGKPLGVLNSGCLIESTRTNASQIDDDDVLRMWSRRYLGARDYVWLINGDTYPQMATFTIGDQPVWQPPGYLADDPHGRLLGRPVVETEYNPGLGSVGDILLFSPSHYQMIRKGGIQSASSIHVQFVTDETAFRFVMRVDGEPLWDTPVTKYKASTDTVSPFVALAATT
jgi:HK97 family phage major capsid protein